MKICAHRVSFLGIYSIIMHKRYTMIAGKSLPLQPKSEEIWIIR